MMAMMIVAHITASFTPEYERPPEQRKDLKKRILKYAVFIDVASNVKKIRNVENELATNLLSVIRKQTHHFK